ncbi:MAG: YtfJ family protein [Rikenellaceae bacterium]|nr:YtfJ family protein [Rikenellaceae bacterium]
MKKFILLLVAVMALLPIAAQELNKQVENVTLRDLNDEAAKLPYFGEKNLLIFYIDPDRHKQNEDFTYEIEENGRASGENIHGFGIINLKDTMLPNGIIRSMARKRTEKNGATVLTDKDRTLQDAWNLGDCNNKFVLMIVSKEGKIVFIRKGELSEKDKEEFYTTVADYR